MILNLVWCLKTQTIVFLGKWLSFYIWIWIWSMILLTIHIQMTHFQFLLALQVHFRIYFGKISRFYTWVRIQLIIFVTIHLISQFNFWGKILFFGCGFEDFDEHFCIFSPFFLWPRWSFGITSKFENVFLGNNLIFTRVWIWLMIWWAFLNYMATHEMTHVNFWLYFWGKKVLD